jgi:hypothetical protein
MKKLTCTLVIIAATLQLVSAADAGSAATTTADAPTTDTAPALDLKKKSSFTMEDTSRNPFWPIGWKPAPKATTAPGNDSAGPQISPDLFLVSSITVDTGGKFAIINGKAMGEGQVFGLKVGTQTYQLTVKAIQDGQVILSRRDQEIAVPLRRR